MDKNLILDQLQVRGFELLQVDHFYCELLLFFLYAPALIDVAAEALPQNIFFFVLIGSNFNKSVGIGLHCFEHEVPLRRVRSGRVADMVNTPILLV